MVSKSEKDFSAGLITEQRKKVLGVIAWCVLNAGGLSVTFAYMQGASVALMNSFVYATNLGLNMIFQITFKISPYTKNMRCGTILFALAAVQLSQLAAPPWEVEKNWLWDSTPVLIWNGLFLVFWAFAVMMVMRQRHLPKNNPSKILWSAIQVACWGSMTDNWAKVTGTWETGSQPWIISMLFYLPTGMWVMVMSVWAMASTNVALYVPTNLCCQLCFNTLFSLIVWREADQFPEPKILVAYLVSYIICIMAIYISTEEADIMANLSNSKEMSSKALSRKEAATPFGESLVALATEWEGVKADKEGGAGKASTRKAVEEALREGNAARVFNTPELIDLVSRLWGRIDPNYSALGTVVGWMKRTSYFQDYLAADPAFEESLERPLSDLEKKAMQEVLAEEETPAETELGSRS